jgi:NAD(P)-dependent dehydrogenase (short-subunit alcohol dehydrogenase family)
MKQLHDKVVVITGATSGIGRATAEEFARQGAKVVIAGRDADALKETKTALETAEEAEVLPVVCDVTQEEQVERLANRAEEAYGHIDVWVNNAGVAMFAKFDESPSDDFRQVMETDYFGYVYGARAAIRRFKTQGHGTLINVDSVEGIAPKPYHSAYSAAKHAVRALASSMRMELALDGLKNIHVCTVMPASVDTPLFAHAANYTGQGVTAPSTSAQPAQVARTIVGLVTKPQREVIMGPQAKKSVFEYMFMPKMYENKHANRFPNRHLSSDQTMPGQGNLYEATGPHSILGGWGKERAQQLNAAKPWFALAGVVVAIGGLATLLFWPGQDRAGKLLKLATQPIRK